MTQGKTYYRNCRLTIYVMHNKIWIKYFIQILSGFHLIWIWQAEALSLAVVQMYILVSTRIFSSKNINFQKNNHTFIIYNIPHCALEGSQQGGIVISMQRKSFTVPYSPLFSAYFIVPNKRI